VQRLSSKLESIRQASGDLETAAGPAPGAGSPASSRKRNASIAGFDESSPSIESPEHQLGDDLQEGRKRPIKRACNECRQQKVSTALPALQRCTIASVTHDPPMFGMPTPELYAYGSVATL
jgi:hypothetical protein